MIYLFAEKSSISGDARLCLCREHRVCGGRPDDCGNYCGGFHTTGRIARSRKSAKLFGEFTDCHDERGYNGRAVAIGK
jgi:hypothetical protein